MLKELIAANRSYRRFFQEVEITSDVLKELIDLARLTAFGGNLQSLRFKIANSPQDNKKIFSCLSWAGYLKNWKGPREGEKPAAYIVVVNDMRIKKNAMYETGLACQSILLGAVEKGFGGCLFGSVDREELCTYFGFEQYHDITLVIALGKPKEQVQIDTLKNDDVQYWRDENRVHHVPKRILEDLLL